ncbi:MAG: hypothetical protein GEU80_07220 [Dehalococcoidia bacterium]|nr:hypothetical protein [Dehalococcoidia bacterium]
MPTENYWTRHRVSRRRALQGAGVGIAGLAGAALVGCGGDDEEPEGGTAPTGTSTAEGGASPAAAGEPKAGGELVLMQGDDPRSLDPAFDVFGACSVTMGNVYNSLLRFTPDLSAIEPELATALPEQPDELTYVMTVQDGVKWQNVDPANGREFTSEDVKYSIERIATDDPGTYQHAYFFLDKVSSIETPDDQTVVFTTAEPYAPMLSYLASPWTLMVNRETVEQFGDLTEHAVGTGPMIFDEWQQDAHIKMHKNPDYWEDGLPYLDAITFLIVPDANSQAALYIDRDVHAVQAGRSQLQRLQDARGADSEYRAQPSQFWKQFRMPPTQEQDPYPAPFDDIRVREAIVRAVEKEAVLDFVYAGDGAITYGPILPMYTQWAMTEELAAFDLQRSKELLDAAGVSEVSGPMMWASTSTETDQIPEVIAQQLAEINVNVTLEPMELAAYYNKNYTYEYTFSTHTPLNNPDPDENLSSYFGRNSTFYKHYNPEIFDIVDEQARTVDVEARKEIVLQAQRMIVEDFPMKFLFTTNVHQFVTNEVKGWFWHVDGYDAGMGRRAWLDV